jgi:hypothetical protein
MSFSSCIASDGVIATAAGARLPTRVDFWFIVVSR